METFPVFSVAIFDFTLNASEALESLRLDLSEIRLLKHQFLESHFLNCLLPDQRACFVEVVSAMVSAADV